MYVRVKRQKVTIFLQTETWESVLEVKSKLQKHLDKDPLDMKLVHVLTGQELEDSRSLSDLKVQNDEVLGLCFKKDTSADGEDVWEEVNITEPPATIEQR